MAKIISLINMKGGVGKSTLTVNLAWHFAGYTNWSKKILVVDLDPQFNASQYLVGVTKYENIIKNNKPTIWDIFEQHTKIPTSKNQFEPKEAILQVVRMRDGGKIDLIPSRLELAQSIKQSSPRKEYSLQKTLKQIENDYDIILIDCPPTESLLTTAAYLSSEFILVPVKPEYLSTIGLPLLASSMTDFHEEYKENHLKLSGIVFNAITYYSPEEKRAKEEVKKLAEQNEWYVFSNEINYFRSYPKGAREGQPIFRTSYARTEQAQQFKAFAKEFAKRIGL
jgi:chromosome partitioning protein